MIAELHAGRDQLLSEAIAVMERLGFGQGKRRGRPPAKMSAMKAKLPGWRTPAAARAVGERCATTERLFPSSS